MRCKNFLKIILCINSLFFAGMLSAATFNIGDSCSGKVIRVFDADTWLFRCENGKTALVRLEGIDAPESKKTKKACWQQPFGDQATEITRQNFLYRYLTLEITDQDKYHRWVGLFYDKNQQSINGQLVAQGLATVYRKYNHAKAWETFEQQAQKNRKGLWHNPPACIITPAIWRHTEEAQRCEKLLDFQKIGCVF